MEGQGKSSLKGEGLSLVAVSILGWHAMVEMSGHSYFMIIKLGRHGGGPEILKQLVSQLESCGTLAIYILLY